METVFLEPNENGHRTRLRFAAHRWKTGQHSEVIDKNQDVSRVTLKPVNHVVSQVVVHVGYQLVVVGVVAS